MGRSKRKRYPPAAIDVNQMRRKLVWLMPLLLGLLWCCWLWAEVGFFAEINALRRMEATVDITHAIVFLPFFSLMLCFMIVLVSLQAIPCERALTWAVEVAFAWFLVVSLFLMLPLVLAVGLLPYRYMPEFGYTKCYVSGGNKKRGPSFWVKNADWCVQGKTRDWVNEQAKLTRP